MKSHNQKELLKLDENNQYGFGMTKPLQTGCIKADSDISFKKLDDLIRTLDIDFAYWASICC